MSITPVGVAPRQVRTRLVAGAPLVAAVCLVAAQIPAAHADPLDNLRGAVNGARAQSTCQALTYSGQLEGVAQKWVRTAEALGSINAAHLEMKGSGYSGAGNGTIASGDPTADATSKMVSSDGIRDCTNKDFGVGMVRDEVIETSYVAVVFGVPKAQAAAPAPAEPPAPPQPTTATVVGGPVNIYNIAHDEVPDPNNGIRGMQVGTAQDGQQVSLAAGGPCKRDDWCKIVMPDDPEHFGFIFAHLQY